MGMVDRRGNMSLLFSDEIKNKLAYELRNTRSHLHIVSAYCKEEAIKFLQSNVVDTVSCKKLLVRFSFNDIVSGATDLTIYDYCKENGWDMYVRFDLHAKTYIFDKLRCIVGSANLTSRGIGITANPNYEIALITEVSEEEMSKVEVLFDNAVLMTDELYSMMKTCLNNRTIGEISIYDDWSDEILLLCKPKVTVLFTYEFPNCDSLSNLKEDSLEFLSLTSGWDIKTIKNAFMKSNVYLWLLDRLESMPNTEIYFGALSALLHDAIINDPKPYRKEVKVLQSNLLNWIAELDINEVKIDRPNHSQRIRLVK